MTKYKYASFQIGDGEDDVILVEIDEVDITESESEADIDDDGDVTPVSKGNSDANRSFNGKEVYETGKEFAKTVDKLMPVVKILKSRLFATTEGADEVSVEFGVKIGAGTDLLIAKASGETNFKISMKWNKKP